MMRHFTLAFAVLLLSSCAAAGPAGRPAHGASGKIVIDFDRMEVGRAPGGFTPMVTGEGVPATWTVSADSSAPSAKNILAQTSRDEGSFHFPMCINNSFIAKDVAVSVRWKTIGGRMNRSGGIVTRFQDKDHYYLVRFNSLEDNINLYCYYTPGARKQITGAYHLILTEETWHTLRVEARGAHFKAWYDGVLQWEADDATIQSAGKVGLWTKSDSVTYFDDLTIENLGESK